MLGPYLKIWEWELNFSCALKAISSPASVVRGAHNGIESKVQVF